MAVESQNIAVPGLPEDLGHHFFTLVNRLLVTLEEGTDRRSAVVLSSCHSGQGVTTIALHLAAALGRTRKRSVLLCDANPLSPGLERALRLAPGPGLAEVLAGKCELKEAARPSNIAGLHVLSAGGDRKKLGEAFETLEFGAFMASVREQYAFAIFDAPPVLDSSATVMLAGAADGAVLVIEAERERWEVAQRAVVLLKSARAAVLGVVLNKRQFHIPGFLYRGI